MKNQNKRSFDEEYRRFVEEIEAEMADQSPSFYVGLIGIDRSLVMDTETPDGPYLPAGSHILMISNPRTKLLTEYYDVEETALITDESGAQPATFAEES